MNKWEFIEAKKLYSNITDGTHDSPKASINGYYLVTSKNIKGGTLDLTSANLISEDDYKNIIKKSKVDKWDVIISMIGEYCGYTYIEKNSNVEYAIKNVGLFKTDSRIEAYWLRYYLLSDYGRYYINQLKSGSSQPYLSLGALRNFPILNPPHGIKKSIVGVLSALDDKIELNNRINAELEAMAKTLYDYWFVQFEFPNADGKPYKSSGGKMVYNETLKREIPEGWEDCTLGDISNLVRGVSYNKQDIQSEIHEDTIKILRATNITKNIIDLNDPILVSNSFVKEEQVLKPFDILITMSSGSIDHIGKNGFYYFDEKVAFGAFCAKIQMDELFRYYIYLYMQSNVFSSTIKNECLGTNINNLNGSMVKGFKHIKPSKYILERFNSLVEPCFKKIRVNIKQNQELATLRDWLLPMLMNGQVTVEGVEKEEVSMAAGASINFNYSRPTYNDDMKFEQWLQHQGLAARGDIDKETLREIFDAMDDEDK